MWLILGPNNTWKLKVKCWLLNAEFLQKLAFDKLNQTMQICKDYWQISLNEIISWFQDFYSSILPEKAYLCQEFDFSILISIVNIRTCKNEIGKTSIALKNEITCLTGWHCCVDFIIAIWLLSKNQHTEKWNRKLLVL